MATSIDKDIGASAAKIAEIALAESDTVFKVENVAEAEEKTTVLENVNVDQTMKKLQNRLSAAFASRAVPLEHSSGEQEETAESPLSESSYVVPPAPTPQSVDDRRKQSVSDSVSGFLPANIIEINKLDPKVIVENSLNPREQEKEDEAVLRGFRHLFNNRFMSAKTIFEQQADRDPLYALALSSMAFLKAVMTSAEHDTTMALDVLNTTYNIAKAQIDAANKGSSVSEYLPSYFKNSPRNTTTKEYPPNGVLRAHVIKAECCLLIAVLQLLQESIIGYVKCGINLRRAYTNYNFVWQKYQSMGENYSAFIDHDTVSGVQFGIGSIHLVLSALPAKILKAISVLGWKPDRQLGFKVLNTCVESKRIRSPMAAVMLLSFYSVATSLAPQVLSTAYMKTAMETLLEAQRFYPNSALYLYFAGRFSRVALDLPLSTQSFLYAADMTKKDWAEVAVTNSCRYEIAVNHIITGNWDHAASSFAYLCKEKYWSQAFCKYLQGACLEMAGKRTEAILAFAEVPMLVVKKLGGRLSDSDAFALQKVTMYQESGYQDLDFHLPILEFACIWNLFYYMTDEVIAQCSNAVEKVLQNIQLREQEEYDQRSQELAPETPLPDHFSERAIALLVKAAIHNVAGQISSNTIFLNWIIDHKDSLEMEPWVVPYALWEAGVTCWKTQRQDRARYLWEMALGYSKYNFEHRLAVRLNLAVSYAEEQGFTNPIPETIDGKKRYSISLPLLTTTKSK